MPLCVWDPELDPPFDRCDAPAPGLRGFTLLGGWIDELWEPTGEPDEEA